MAHKKLFIFILLVVLSCCSLVSFAQENSDRLSNLIQYALENNPQIKQAYHKWKAAEHKINVVTSLPDPQVSYSYFGANVETRLGPQEQKFGVRQKVPFPGKRKTQAEVQSKEAQILKQKYESLQNEVVKKIKFAYYDLYWIDQALQINEEEKSLLEDIEEVAQRKYESQLSSQQNVIKLQVELSKIIEKISLIKLRRKSVEAKMNRLLNRSQDKPIAVIKELNQNEFPYKLQEIFSQSRVSTQELLAAQLAVEKSEYEKSLARMDYLPDFSVGYEYIDIGSGHTTSDDDGKDAWRGMISVNVPIWIDKIQSKIHAKEAELKAARESQEDIKNKITAEIEDLYFQIITSKEIVTLYETALIPQSRQAFESSQTGFETGSVSFLDWLDAHRTYLQTRLAYHKAVTDYQKAIAFLERVIGTQLGGENEK